MRISTLLAVGCLSLSAACSRSGDTNSPPKPAAPPAAAPGDAPTAPPPAAPEKASPLLSELLSEGSAAPEFSAQAHSGQDVKLSALRGKVVVLYFYPKDNTPGCTREAEGFRDAHQSYEDEGAVVIGVSTQGNESHREFAREHGLPFLLLPDENGAIARSYGVDTTGGVSKRVTFIIDPEGKIAKVYDSVSPQRHAQEVLADIASLRGK